MTRLASTTASVLLFELASSLIINTDDVISGTSYKISSIGFVVSGQDFLIWYLNAIENTT